jgi:hypothetical protein
MNKAMVASLLPSPISFFLLLEAKMGDNNKLDVIAFFSVGVVTKKVTAIVVTFFKCFVAKKVMAY